ncbi:hypothetical protein DM813_14535 [Pseudomonas alkylphenolica]|uniref:Alpha-xenorhabdolysin family binary toxin subunit B n=1 Tax=Pseudomonas alkylphenolica TaxID=237609 RepID=A0A443ZSP1_9PSED|nr:alpha-xenorhabdolysin family binary toxin subunit B [Pseudomonas alkylphenolica]RWU22390.1 hypothetical protein DM813_14535 [Pseudomonas alkylphenolica]
MKDNVVSLHTRLRTPEMTKILSVASAYSGYWEKRTFDFLPLLHASVERHYKGILRCVEYFAKNSEVLAVSIKSENIELLLNDLKASAGDAEEEEFLLEEIQRSLANIGNKLDVLLSGVETATKSISSLPVYDASRDHTNYQATRTQLADRLQAISTALTDKRAELAELERVIGVFEANGVEKAFEGKLPTVEQVQALAASGATPAGAALAVEQAVEALNKLLSGVQEVKQYSQLQGRRRALQTEVNELVAEQREQEKRGAQIESYLNALSEYSPLVEKRLEWLAEKNQIRAHLTTVRNQLRNNDLKGAESVEGVNKLLAELLIYVRHIVAEFKKSF